MTEGIGVRMHVAQGVWGALRAALAAMLVVLAAAGHSRAEVDPVRLTVEVSWSPVPGSVVSPQAPGVVGATLELSSGRVAEAISWPSSNDPAAVAGLAAPEPGPGGVWTLGRESSGRVRARIESSIRSTLSVRAGGTTWTIPVAALLDGPQRSPSTRGVVVEVRRLPWDSLEVRAPGDGLSKPGTLVPVTIGLNILEPEPTEVDLTLSARLRPIRGDRPSWEESTRLTLRTNTPAPPLHVLSVPTPTEQGTYVLELAATWTPREPPADGSRLSRLWRRLGKRPAGSALRRVSLAVVGEGDEAPGGAGPVAGGPDRGEVLVDAAELGRPRGLRPRPEGRTPADSPAIDASWAVPPDLLVAPPRRERIWNLISRVGTDDRPLAVAGADGLSWTAAPLKVAHPDRPHRLELTVLGGQPSAMAVAMVAPGDRPRLLLDARGSGPEVAPGGGRPAVLSWLVWPDTADPVLVVANRSGVTPLRLGEARLIELAGEPAPLSLVGTPPDGGRGLAVRMTGLGDLERFGGAGDDGPDDPIARGTHLASYLGSVGASAVVLPTALPDRDVRAALGGQAAEDPIGPDRRSALRSVLDRRGVTTILEVRVDGETLPGLPPPGTYEAEAEGLARLDRSGKADSVRPSYNLLRPEVQEAMTRQVCSALRGVDGAGGGPTPSVLLRLGPGPTLPGRPDTGLDDETYARFVAEAIKGADAPGLDRADPGRFASRHDYLTGPASVPWLTWRSRRVGAFYARLSEAVAEASPGSRLLLVTPGLDDGPAGAEARRFDRDGLPPDGAWRSLGLDLADWPRGDGPGPILLRGAGVGSGDLEHDLSTHPALDAQVRGRPARGLTLGLSDRPSGGETRLDVAPGPLRLSSPEISPGSGGDEAFGHAMAALDPGWVVVSSPCLAGQEDRLRRFARVYRALPSPGEGPAQTASGGVVVRSIPAGPSSYFCLANDTPFSARVAAVVASTTPVTIEDLGRGVALEAEAVAGGRRATVDLPPFGVSALRVDVPGARLASISASYEARRESLRQAVSRRLQALSQGGAIADINPGFEPGSVIRQASGDPDDPSESATGWAVEGGAGATVEIDRSLPRTGRGSLLLTAPKAPAWASSPGFSTPGPTATLRAFLRTDPPDAAVRVRIESDPGAAEPVQLAADLPEADRGAWSPMALRAPGLPSGPDAMLRLRFELRSPGRLWIDDLALTGPGLAQARSCLTAALQAYEEGRIADFARLARSHWVVEAGGPIEARPPDQAVPPLAGEVSTDLPSRTRLR